MKTNILDPGFDLNLRPMRYPGFFEMFKAAIENTWTVGEVDFRNDPNDLKLKMSVAERHLIHRLVAFFATGDEIVSNNLVLNLYKHINAPEARMYLSRQLYEEALHVQFYLTLLDTYIPDPLQREEAFRAVENIPSIKRKAEFCNKWLFTTAKLEKLTFKEDRRQFLMNLICFATCIEGLFFFAAFAYVYFLRSKGLLHGLAGGTNWVFRDESMHMQFALQVVNVVKSEEPEIFDAVFQADVVQMLEEALECEMQFATDVLSGGISGLSVIDMRLYLEFVVDQRLKSLGIKPRYGAKNPFSFMALQDVQSFGNFFERTISEYKSGVGGDVTLDGEF